jgi:superfamily I DNA/RNA helicase
MVGAKGLSAKHVIVLGCEANNMERTTPLEFYVALSRARETLHLVSGDRDPEGSRSLSIRLAGREGGLSQPPVESFSDGAGSTPPRRTRVITVSTWQCGGG